MTDKHELVSPYKRTASGLTSLINLSDFEIILPIVVAVVSPIDSKK